MEYIPLLYNETVWDLKARKKDSGKIKDYHKRAIRDWSMNNIKFCSVLLYFCFDVIFVVIFRWTRLGSWCEENSSFSMTTIDRPRGPSLYQLLPKMNKMWCNEDFCESWLFCFCLYLSLSQVTTVNMYHWKELFLYIDIKTTRIFPCCLRSFGILADERLRINRARPVSWEVCGSW